ncbi:MAG: helix-hairpin-helix domain-containing protein [Chloroflexota bacterium]|nr:helix-hairpin-helix domain-containing protein [Chloroflexota bacterium]
MDALSRYRGYIALTLLYAVLFGTYVLYDRRPQPEPMEIIEPTEAAISTPVPIRVHVVGAVNHPGVYALAPGSRWLDAVQAAHGMTDDAYEEGVNLAAFLQDGQQVWIPREGEATRAPGESFIGAQGGKAKDAKIDINTASAADLEELPGIGPVYAQRIVSYRESNGPFSDAAQIMEIKGIGESRYEEIRPLITVR